MLHVFWCNMAAMNVIITSSVEWACSEVFDIMRPVLWTCLVLLLSPRPLMAQVDNYNYDEVSRATFVDTVTYSCERCAVHSGTTIECSVFCSIPGRPRCFGLAVEHENYCWVCGEGSTRSSTADEIPQDASFWVQHGEHRYKLTT